MENVQRVRYVSENYEGPQGLRRVPYHLAILVVVLLGAWLGMDGESSDLRLAQNGLFFVVTFAVFLLVPGFYSRIGRFYERRYGRVRSRQRAGLPVGWVLFFAGGIIVALAVWREVFSGFGGGPALYGIGLSVGVVVVTAVWFSRWWDGGRSRYAAHWLVLAVLVAPATLASVAGFGTASPAWPFLAIYLGGDTVGGVLDHLLLVRTLKAVPEEGPDAA